MATFIGEHYPYTRVGVQKILRALQPGPPFFAMEAEWVADEVDAQAMGLVPGVAYRRWKFNGYPLTIDEDTTFENCNFSQEKPHTDGVFKVADGAKVVFVDCTLVNVRIPDGAEIHGGNARHLIRDEGAGVNLLCECEKCCSYFGELQDAIAEQAAEREASHARGDREIATTTECFDGRRWLHHAIKERTKIRREFEALVEADVADVKALNAAAVAAKGA
jgi:hypothetical protein